MLKKIEAGSVVSEETTYQQPEVIIQDVLSRFASLPISEHRDWAEELLRALSELYGAALEKIVEGLGEVEGGAELLKQLSQDERVSGILLLHDLHPLSVLERVQVALEQLNQSQRASDIKLLDLSPETGEIHLRVIEAQGRWEVTEGVIRKVFDRHVPEIWRFTFERPIPGTPVRLRTRNRVDLMTANVTRSSSDDTHLVSLGSTIPEGGI